MIDILESECSCDKCSLMCHAPCCGTPEEMQKLIDAGYGKRLMFDDGPGGENILKPALKGYEGEIAPWEVASEKGCTFWIKGKCKLHSLGLKPSQGKLTHHSLTLEQDNKIGEMVNESWEDGKGDEVITNWKLLNNKEI